MGFIGVIGAAVYNLVARWIEITGIKMPIPNMIPATAAAGAVDEASVPCGCCANAPAAAASIKIGRKIKPGRHKSTPNILPDCNGALRLIVRFMSNRACPQSGYPGNQIWLRPKRTALT